MKKVFTFRIIKNSGLPAFSIMETLVAMVVSAMVMGLIFVVFSVVTERVIDYKNQNRFVSDMNRLTYSVNKDLFDNQKMEISDSALVFKSYSGQKLVYVFSNDNIVRSSETFTDTFLIKVDRFTIDTMKSASKKTIFCKLNLRTDVNGSQFDLKFYKRIYADELLQSSTP